MIGLWVCSFWVCGFLVAGSMMDVVGVFLFEMVARLVKVVVGVCLMK